MVLFRLLLFSITHTYLNLWTLQLGSQSVWICHLSNLCLPRYQSKILINSNLENFHVILQLKPPWTAPINICHNLCFDIPRHHTPVSGLQIGTHPPEDDARRRFPWSNQFLNKATSHANALGITMMLDDGRMESHKINVKMYASILASSFIHVSRRWSYM